MADKLLQYASMSLEEITEMLFEEQWAEYQKDEGEKLKLYLLMNSEMEYDAVVGMLKIMLRNQAEQKAEYIKALLKYEPQSQSNFISLSK